jgi:hypothetical protein
MIIQSFGAGKAVLFISGLEIPFNIFNFSLLYYEKKHDGGKMERVKMFSCDTPEDLEIQINRFLEEIEEIVEIQYAPVREIEDRHGTFETLYTAMVVYEVD